MKGKKIIVPVLLASMVSAPVVSGVSALTSKVSADSTPATQTIEGASASVTGYSPEAYIGNHSDAGQSTNTAKITVPTLTATGTKKITMTDPLGVETDVTTIMGEALYVPHQGYYTFDFEVKTEGAVTSTFEQLTIFVKGNTYSMNMPENSYHVVPSTYNLENGGTTAKFPVPEVYKNGEELTTLDGQIVLNITKPNGTKENGIVEIKTDATSGEDYFEYKFTEEGRYRVRYTYVVGGEVVSDVATKIVKLVSGYDLSDVEINFSLTSQMPTSAEVGKEVTLPEIDVFDKNNSSKLLDAYTKITVKYLGNEAVSDAEKEFVVTDFKFTPKYAGTYSISYEALIPAWNKTSGVRTFLISEINDVSAPTPYFTNSYTVSEDGKISVGGKDITALDTEEQLKELGDLSYNLDAYYEVDNNGEVTVEIPAMFGVDNSSSIKDILENKTDEGKLRTTREVYKYGYASNKMTLVNASGTEAKVNEVAVVTFGKDGKWKADDENYYVVKYTIGDSKGNTRSYSYKLYIRTINSLPKAGPEVTLDPALTGTSVDSNGTLTFSKPTVVDKHDGKVYDENVETHTYYSYTSTSENLIELTDDDVNDNGEYVIKIDNTGKPENIYIVTKAKNHYANETVATKTVKIKYASDDTTAPVTTGMLSLAKFNEALVTGNGFDKTEIILGANGQYKNDENKTVGLFAQNAIVKLPEMSFTDADNSLDLNMVLTYTAPNGGDTKTVKLSDYYVSSTDAGSGLYSHTIKNAQFTASNAGYYVVTYIAKDGGNNVSFKSYGIYVNDTVGPRIEIPNINKFSEALRPGQTFDVPSAVVYDNDAVLENAEVTITIEGPGFLWKSSDNKQFTPSKTGSYYVTYTAKDAAGNPSTYKASAINVKASLNEETFKIDYVTNVFETDYTNVEYQEDSNEIEKINILIPKATASETEMGERVDVKVTVKDGNGLERTVGEVTNDNGEYTTEEFNSLKEKYFQFTATTQGVHTVTYEATNQFGISAKSKTYEIKVGDTAAPELTWKDQDENLPKTVAVGSTWKFDYNFVEISDVESSNDTVENGGITSTIKMIDPDGEEIKDVTEYTFDKVGEYTFTITLKDKAGNSTQNDYRYTITVEEEESANKQVNNTTGTILIVTSVVVLGGVVVYFVLSGKKATSNSKKKSNKKDNK